MEKIDRLYALLERSDVDEDTKAAVRWAIFKLEGRLTIKSQALK